MIGKALASFPFFLLIIQDSASQSCQDHVQDKCDVTSNVLEMIHDVSEPACQLYCKDVFGELCSMYVHEQSHGNCYIYQMPMEEYLSTCTEASGPVTPAIQDCTIDSGCNSFLQSNCTLTGNILDNLIEVLSEDLCQRACSYYPGCNAYHYDKMSHVCVLRETGAKTCDHAIGIANPDVSTCRHSAGGMKMEKQPQKSHAFKKLDGCKEMNDQLNNIATEDLCQKSCRLQESCSFFEYITTKKICRLYSSEDTPCTKSYHREEMSQSALHEMMQSYQDEGDCQDFVLDNCDYQNNVLETIHGVPQEACHLYCRDIFSDFCTFFVYEKSKENCYIHQDPQQEFFDSCAQVLGPQLPAFSECSALDDPCDFFRESNCTATGEIVENLIEVPDEFLCQEACYLKPDCSYFQYDRLDRVCVLYNGLERFCDQFIGPADPDYEECVGSSTVVSTTVGLETSTPFKSTTDPPERIFFSQNVWTIYRSKTLIL